MKCAFWSAVAVLVYTYLGYPAWLWLRSRRQRPVARSAGAVSVSVVLAARNESAVIERKLKNLLSLGYPKELCEIIVVSDGSTDGTNEILQSYANDARVRVIATEHSRGKAACLNDAVAAARGEVVVFTDARQQIEPGALLPLVEVFADPEVGCASGELMLGDVAAGESARGLGLYWRIEKRVREMESESGSVVGATGALYAIRRNLFVPLPAGTILDDVFIPMQVARQGFRVLFVPAARAWDVADQGSGQEFARKVRTLFGNYQLVQLAPWLLGRTNPLRFEFVSHKLLRLVAPFALALAFFSTLALNGPLYRTMLLLQLLFYCLSLVAMMKLAPGPVGKIADAAGTFVLLNTAALVAFAKFVTGRRVAWVR
jgi:biofilm PGA synthesis N-glycosyltransferase PgaC